MTSQAHQLGPFVLDRRVGHGGMAEVWGGHHERSGRPVAVKFVTATPALRERFVAAFRHEVRAVAALDHPRVVAVYDHGEVPAGLPFLQGAPWLAMEWCPGGSLGERPPHDWFGTHKLLRDILGALAHAHAHGVLHRDVKPANVLATEMGWKLADFGIAATAEGGESSLGTPAYAAPEQIAGRRDDQGPWTDLFALGCTAWHVLCGVPPFGGTLAARRRGLRSAWSPRFDVPIGLLTWLDGLLGTSPGDRYRFAADALAALEALGAPADLRDFTPTGPLNGGDATWFEDVTEETTAEGVRPAPQAPLAAARRPAPEPRGGMSPLADVGLGLLAVRHPPIVGREAERAQLWDALLNASETGTAGLVAILGAAGTGKTRLARWLCERAHEAGAASYTWVSHGVGLEGTIAGVVRGWFGTASSPGALEEDIVRRWPTIDPAEAAALARVLCGAPVPANSRHALLRRAMTRDADRARIIVLDAAPADWDAILFASHLLDAGSAAGSGVDGRLLVVVTGRPETRSDRPAQAAAFERLLRRPRTRTLRIGAMTNVETAALVRELLPLDAAFAGQIADRSHGNPAYAVQWVRVQAARGALEPGPSGYHLSAEAADLPDGERAPWRALVASLAELYPDVRSAELAAALGDRVHGDEWRRACVIAGIPSQPAVIEQLVDWGVCESEQSADVGFAFTNALFREALLDHAGPRRTSLHATCVMVLGDASPQRLGPQLVAAGRRSEGARCLVAGARQRFLDDDELGSLAMLSDARKTLEGLTGPEAELERFLADVDEVQVQYTLGDAGAAGRAHASATRRSAGLVLPAGARMRFALASGTLAWISGNMDTALTAYESAWALSPEVGDGRLTSQALRGIATTLQRLVRLNEAITWADLAVEHAATLTDPAPYVFALVGRAQIARHIGDLPSARACAERAAESARAHPWHTATATVEELRGDLALGERRYEDALGHYTIARDWWRTRGGFSRSFAELMMAIVNLHLGRYAQAREGLEQRVDRAWLAGAPRIGIGAELTLAGICAGEGDFAGMTRHMLVADADARALDEADPDYVVYATVAADLARGRPEEAFVRSFITWQEACLKRDRMA